MCIYLCDDAHFVWPRVRSFLRVFTLVLATPPRGIRPNHTLLPIVRRFWIFLLFKKQQKPKIKIYAKSVKPPPLREEVKRRPIEQFGQLTKMWQSTNCWLSWPCLGILMMIAERMKGPKVCGGKERVRKILPAVYLEEEWVSRTMGSGQL